jgi:protein TonB
MKHLWLTILIAIAPTPKAARAQALKPRTPALAVSPAPKAPVYTYVEEMPQLPGGGGNPAIVFAIQKGVHLPSFHGNYPERSRVMVEFTVTETADVRNIRILQGIDSRVDTAVVRAVQALPRFTLGRQRGIPVSVKYTVPITFHWQ